MPLLAVPRLLRLRWRSWAGAVPLLGLWPPAALAEPAPVSPGLWEVSLLTTHDAGRTPAAQPAPAPQKRQYRICISPARAHAPMSRPLSAAQSEVVIDRSSISGTYTERDAQGRARPVEFAYRRLDANTFEGSHDVETPAGVVRAQYLARRVASDCGALRPQPAAASGEP